MNRPTRRGLLGGAAVLAAAPVASASVPTQAHPDADLLAACNEFLRIQREFEAYYDTLSEDMEEGDPGLTILNPVPGLVERIVALRATTADGHLARARCRAFPCLPQARACQDDPEAATEDRFTAAELRDLVAMERGAVISRPPAVQAPAHPDAELLAACAAFDLLEQQYIDLGGNWPVGSPEDAAAEAERDRLYDAQDPLIARICELRAVTREGMAARARSLALWDAELMKDGPGDAGECFTAAIVRA